MKPLKFWGFLFFISYCTTTKFQVPEEKFFTDGYSLDKGYTQYVEIVDDKTLALPVTGRFRQNCQTAQQKGSERFKQEKNIIKVESILLGEYFEANGACRVRIALKG
ncbi:MAG TPA: hypothetical protein PLY93_08340 [Turneriella sp.]|nr:hypothetical protein [Turneriella sp.]